MKSHYGLSDEAYKSLQEAGITDIDLLKMVPLFDPHGTGANLGSKISLFNYIDKKGSFNEPPKKLKHKLVARAIFDSLVLKADEKLQILAYLDGEYI